MTNMITTFTYTDLSVPVAAELEAAAARIRARLTQQVRDIIEIGHDLIEVKSKLHHGQFERWLHQEFNMTDRTARRFMQAATWAEGKSDTVSVLTPTAIYALSAPSTPESVQQKVLESVKSGEPVKADDIRHLIKDAQIKRQISQRAKGAREEQDAPPKEIKNKRERQRAEVRAEKQRKKKDKMERRALAAKFSGQAQALAFMLIDDPESVFTPLAELSEEEINKTFRECYVASKKVHAAIIEAYHSAQRQRDSVPA